MLATLDGALRNVDLLLSYLLVPLAAMFASAYVQSSDQSILRLRPSAACDLFAFTFALDAGLLINRSSVVQRVMIEDASYESVVVAALVLSVLLLLFSGKVQIRVAKKICGRARYYPVTDVALCWVIAITLIAAHFAILFG